MEHEITIGYIFFHNACSWSDVHVIFFFFYIYKN